MYKTELDWVSAYKKLLDWVSAYKKLEAESNKRITALEKENAELKGLKDVATLIRANNDTVITLMQLNNMLVSKNQQLTKAKEIIKGLLSFVDSLGNYSGGIFAKAEQFLKEVENV